MFTVPEILDRPHPLLARLQHLQRELVDLAFELERSGRVDAADVAIRISSELAEFCAESTRGDEPPKPEQVGEPSPAAG